MGNGRSIKRKVNKYQSKSNYIEVLSVLLGDFYEFLGQTNKPSDQEVRDRFTSDKDKWFQYCEQNQLSGKDKDLFVLNVATMWNHNKKN